MKLSALIFALIAVAVACLFRTASGPAVSGVVIDADTGLPVKGAIVVARTIGRHNNPARTYVGCYHGEIATSNGAGEFTTPKWSDPGGRSFWYVTSSHVTVEAFKRGYISQPVPAGGHNRLKLTRFAGTPADYEVYLSGLIDYCDLRLPPTHNIHQFRAVLDAERKLVSPPERARICVGCGGEAPTAASTPQTVHPGQLDVGSEASAQGDNGAVAASAH